MLAVSHHSSSSLPSTHHGVMDEPGTIDPATLNAPAPTIAPNLPPQPSLRGTKRSRSPDEHGTRSQEAGDNEPKTNKRSKFAKPSESPSAASHQMQLAPPPQSVRTPQAKTQSLPQSTQSQSSPARSTPGSAKVAAVKSLPTSRDHTTDQLGPEGDEYIPREVDPDGDRKVSKDGYPLDGRSYTCHAFPIPNRGDKLFMLATECARKLGYRDSYLLFNKNRSLFKIVASQAEKDYLIQQEILPYSYRSRQIAIVTARSMFRQFGSRLVENGRRVRDDYWETKAIKQGFTEEDPAGEKRPGAARAREAAAAEANQAALTSLPQGEIIYSNGPGMDAQPPGVNPVAMAPLPMIHLPSEDLRPNNFGNMMRPRQEITGPPHHDRTQTSSAADILSQASQAAEYNRQLGQTRGHRAKFLEDYWRRPHEQPTTETQSEGNVNAVVPQHMQSPQAVSATNLGRTPQDSMSHPGPQMMAQSYAAGYPHQQNPMTSPVQQMHRSMGPGQMHQSSPSMTMSATPGHRQTPAYAPYQQSQMWQTPQPQPQPSPLSQPHHLPQYGQQQHHQSPMPPPPPQMAQPQSMAYPSMNPMSNPAFSGMNRSMYQPNASPQQYNMQSGPGQQPGTQGWPTAGSPGNMQQEWPRYQ